MYATRMKKTQWLLSILHHRIGDLNARNLNWHDENSNACGHRLVEWVDGEQSLTIFKSSHPTSTRSRAVIDLTIAPFHISSELAKIDRKMRGTDHYLMH